MLNTNDLNELLGLGGHQVEKAYRKGPVRALAVAASRVSQTARRMGVGRRAG